MCGRRVGIIAVIITAENTAGPGRFLASRFALTSSVPAPARTICFISVAAAVIAVDCAPGQ
jgi:hypothetical protein